MFGLGGLFLSLTHGIDAVREVGMGRRVGGMGTTPWGETAWGGVHGFVWVVRGVAQRMGEAVRLGM